jgi:aminoglycoside phosphotransferase (APT) family kinase protein
VSAKVTDTGLAVLVLAVPGEAPCAVMKMPLTPAADRGLARETAILTALHRKPRLGPWRELLPCPREQGSVEGQPYRVDSMLSGRPATGLHIERSVLEVAAETIDVLHRVTLRALPTDFDPGERWVDVHIEELARRTGRSRSTDLALERLGAELREALAGGSFRACWVHGDYWLGNLLFSNRGSASVTAEGIVDWDAAGPLELALHDLLHLLLYTRRITSGRELGQIVRDQMLDGKWSAEERAVLDRHPAWRGDGYLSERHALMLYWLRHAAMHARQQPSPAGHRYRWWERRNVLPMLNAL